MLKRGLRIDTIHSKKSSQTDSIIESVRTGELDGIAAVGMLGEGFDLPELKIAVVHSPHKSLASTLQFTGRISRSAPEEYGTPRFIAVPEAVNELTAELFKEDQDWSELIPNLADAAVEDELAFRKFLGRFRRLDGAVEKISLYGLKPYLSTKLYQITGRVDLTAPSDLPVESLLSHNIFETEDFAVYITAKTTEPKWSPGGELFYSSFDLFAYLYDETRSLLLEHSTDDEIAKAIRMAIVKGEHVAANKGKLSGLLEGAEKVVYQQVGLGKTGAAGGRVAQYKTYNGNNAGKSVASTDSRVSTPHHVLAKIDGVKSIGFSGSGSVWSMQRGSLADFYHWGKQVIEVVDASDRIMRLPGLPEDFQTYPVERLDAPIIAAEFASKVFELDATLIRPQDPGENLSVLSLSLYPQKIDDFTAEIAIQNAFGRKIAQVNYDCRELKPFVLNDQGQTFRVALTDARGKSSEISFPDFLEGFPLTLFLMNGATIYNNELKPLSKTYTDLDDECYVDHAQNWEDCVIAKEFWDNNDDRSQYSGSLSVQDSVVQHLSETYPDAWILVDHGAPELADVIALDPTSTPPELHFLHCKASSEAPGRRVGDLFEVIGQTIKGSRWIRHEQLIEELVQRITTRAELHQGNADDLVSYLEQRGPNSFAYLIYAVQPGLNVYERGRQDTDACTRSLLGSFEWLRNQEIEFRVMGWNRPDGSARWVKRPDA